MVRLVSTGRTISTSEYVEKRNRAKKKRRILATSLVLATLLVLVVVSRLPQLQIKNVVVTGAPATGPDSVKAEIEEVLAGRYFWLIPHSNVLLYRKGAMKEMLAASHPRFSRIDVSLEGLETLTVDVDEREPFALYCESDERCWFLDNKGFIFDQAPSFSDGVYLEFSAEPKPEDPQGKFLLPTAAFESIADFVTALFSFRFEPWSIAILPDSIVITTKGAQTITVSREGDFARAKSNLEDFLNSPSIKAQGDFVQKVSKLDLRTEDKVFYTFKTE